MRSRLVPAFTATTLSAVLGACQFGSAPVTGTVDDRAVDEAQVRTTAARWEKAIAVHDIEGILSFYTDDGWQLPENGAIARDVDQRRAFWKTIEALPVATDTVDVVDRIEVAESGDLAVQYGEFRQVITDRTGASTSVPQKFVNVWRKDMDGDWKVAASMATVEN